MGDFMSIAFAFGVEICLSQFYYFACAEFIWCIGFHGATLENRHTVLRIRCAPSSRAFFCSNGTIVLLLGI